MLWLMSKRLDKGSILFHLEPFPSLVALSSVGGGVLVVHELGRDERTIGKSAQDKMDEVLSFGRSETLGRFSWHSAMDPTADVIESQQAAE